MEIYSDLLKIDYDGRITGAGAYVEAEEIFFIKKTFRPAKNNNY